MLSVSGRTTPKDSPATFGSWDWSPLKSKLAKFAVFSLARTAWAIRLIAKFLPRKISYTLLGVFDSYIDAMTKSVGDRNKATSMTVRTFQKMMMSYAIQMGDKYDFPSYHEAIKEPFNYYDLCRDYFGKLINFKHSRVRWPERWDAIVDQLARGENVVLLANHQSEADAAFIPLLTEISHPGLGDRIIYVAGDRVIDDTLAKPFSMGRNLLCVYSKKHINNVPALRSVKMRKNIATIKEMERLMKEGGNIIWIAPSGGRDRPDAAGVLLPDAWDPDSVELLRKVSSKAGAKPTHFYPLAMATANILPPPPTLEKDLGEVRSVDYCGIGLSLAEELDVSPESPAYEGVDVNDDAARKAALAKFAHGRVVEEYMVIEKCMTDDVGEIDHSFVPLAPAF
jgi:glycerol-3-phosphate O-acyltransferase